MDLSLPDALHLFTGLSIACRGERSKAALTAHEGRAQQVAEFVIDPTTGAVILTLGINKLSAEGMHSKYTETAIVDGRERWWLNCNRCGENITRYPTTVHYARIQKLIAAGVSECSLHALASIMM
ncbi:MAG: hypothetical protein V4531_08500 [Actinomycetota bacterium]